MSDAKIKETGITPEQVLAIISALRGSQIRLLKYRGLHIEQHFETKASAPTEQPSWPVDPVQTPDPATPAAFSRPITTPVTKAPELDEDDRLELIKLEDPEEYERLLEKRELENASDDSADY
jgi:hypothetical protein